METRYTYKRQGDGRDSWLVEELKGETVVNKYMVYEDPTKDFIDKLTGDQLIRLDEKLDQINK
jgi:hypothetical protein